MQQEEVVFMMAALFLLFNLSMISIYFNRRLWAMWLIVIGILLSFLMLWHHATSVLQINL